MRILLITPPMTQINSPYPATPYLKAFLSSQGHEVKQIDLGLDLILKLMTREGLLRLKSTLVKGDHNSDSVGFFLEAFDDYAATIEPVIHFLQGKDSSLALRIARRSLVPEGPRFQILSEHDSILLSKFGEMGLQDQAKYIASLYLDDLADVVKQGLDPDFEFSRYGESLASSRSSFQPLEEKLNSVPSLLDQMLQELLENYQKSFQPELVGLTLPFPGNVYGGLRAAQILKNLNPQVQIVMGGGYVNTELRKIEDPRIFKYTDFLIFDDGEMPLQRLISYLQGELDESRLMRTRYLKNNQIQWVDDPTCRDLPFKESLTPDYSDLRLTEYVSMVEMPNPMHRMWSDFRWNKLILAHGCYWKKCTFCDVNLDYIGRFEPQKASRIVDHIEKMIQQTGATGFHFVDEAGPPALLKQVSEEIIRRGLKISWWGNLRFDSQFDEKLAELMVDAGCVAVTGGLEVATPRLLSLINKGVDFAKLAQVTKSFKKAGIYVHAYLMYGFPTQTDQDTIDSLEMVRQLFLNQCIDSAFWHRFLATVHSPVGLNPDKFGIQLRPREKPDEGLFAEYEVPFVDPTKANHDKMAFGLKKALYNFMHGVGLEEPLQFWFDQKIPKTTVNSKFVYQCLKTKNPSKEAVSTRS
jgi:hypothetical protein